MVIGDEYRHQQDGPQALFNPAGGVDAAGGESAFFRSLFPDSRLIDSPSLLSANNFNGFVEVDRVKLTRT